MVQLIQAERFCSSSRLMLYAFSLNVRQKFLTFSAEAASLSSEESSLSRRGGRMIRENRREEST